MCERSAWKMSGSGGGCECLCTREHGNMALLGVGVKTWITGSSKIKGRKTGVILCSGEARDIIQPSKLLQKSTAINHCKETYSFYGYW